MKQKRNKSSRPNGIFKKPAVWLFSGILVGTGMLFMSLQPSKVKAGTVTVYKSPTCGCCKDWITHLKRNGFTVHARDHSDMNAVKSELGVPRNLQSCHTATVDGYVFEGHVPADLIAEFLSEKSGIKGLSVPGMPMGSPGMEGPRQEPYDVVAFDHDGGTRVYATR